MEDGRLVGRSDVYLEGKRRLARFIAEFVALLHLRK